MGPTGLFNDMGVPRPWLTAKTAARSLSSLATGNSPGAAGVPNGHGGPRDGAGAQPGGRGARPHAWEPSADGGAERGGEPLRGFNAAPLGGPVQQNISSRLLVRWHARAFFIVFIVFSGARSGRSIPPALCARVIQVSLWITAIQFSLFPGLLSLFPGLSPFFRVLSTTSP